MIRPPQPRLSSAPLVARVEARGGWSGIADGEHGFGRRSYVRAKTTGEVTMCQADEMAVKLLGCHPCEVWGEAWWISTGKSLNRASYYPQDECATVDA